jgi:hypothetical protein
LVLASGTHAAFELGARLAFDLRIVARPGAVIDAGQAPVRIEGLAAQRSIELVGLVIAAEGAQHPALVVEDARGVVLLKDAEVRGKPRECTVELRAARAVALQGGAIEGGLWLARGSRATASGVRLSSFELTGGSVLETRGGSGPRAAGEERKPGWSPAVPGRIEAGSRWLERAAAPRVEVGPGRVTIAAEEGGLAWLGASQRLGFQVHARRWVEGVLLLDPTGYAGVGPVRPLSGGRASWSLGALPMGEHVYLQGLVVDPGSGRVCLTDVVREDR